MNAYLKDRTQQLIEQSEQLEAEHHAMAQLCREDGNLEKAIWWEGLADKASNRAARLRSEAEDSQLRRDENRSNAEDEG